MLLATQLYKWAWLEGSIRSSLAVPHCQQSLVGASESHLVGRVESWDPVATARGSALSEYHKPWFARAKKFCLSRMPQVAWRRSLDMFSLRTFDAKSTD
jgi:hypothetical protein